MRLLRHEEKGKMDKMRTEKFLRWAVTSELGGEGQRSTFGVMENGCCVFFLLLDRIWKLV